VRTALDQERHSAENGTRSTRSAGASHR
jgi:hypothetical protein